LFDRSRRRYDRTARKGLREMICGDFAAGACPALRTSAGRIPIGSARLASRTCSLSSKEERPMHRRIPGSLASISLLTVAFMLAAAVPASAAILTTRALLNGRRKFR
jgi:hypothetical protein